MPRHRRRGSVGYHGRTDRLADPPEVDGLLRVVNELKAAGICVVFVSHRLDEVMEVADRISVMRDGKLVGTAGQRTGQP